MKGDSFGKVTYLGKLGKMTSQIRPKSFKVYTTKPIADAVKKHLKMLSQSEQVKQNEDLTKGRRNWSNQSRLTINGFSTNQPIAKTNTAERFGKLVELDRETS